MASHKLKGSRAAGNNRTKGRKGQAAVAGGPGSRQGRTPRKTRSGVPALLIAGGIVLLVIGLAVLTR